MLAASKPGRNGSRCIVDRSGRTQSVGSFVVRWWIGWSKANKTRPGTTSNSHRISYQRRKTKTSIGLLHHFAFLFFSSSFSLLFPGLVVFCFFFSTFATETEREREIPGSPRTSFCQLLSPLLALPPPPFVPSTSSVSLPPPPLTLTYSPCKLSDPL